MNILILGPQGSGKGTQARLLADKFGFFYFEAGAFLRELSKTNTRVKETIDSGKLVPGDEMASYVESFFDEKEIYDDILFDSFPRTVEQYAFIKKWMNEKNVVINLVFVLKVSEETTIKRLSARRLDPVSGKIYNLITDKPPADVDVTKLIQREDDKPAAIKKRLELYKNMTMPLIEELKKGTKVVEINAEISIKDIQIKMENVVKNAKN